MGKKTVTDPQAIVAWQDHYHGSPMSVLPKPMPWVKVLVPAEPPSLRFFLPQPGKGLRGLARRIWWRLKPSAQWKNMPAPAMPQTKDIPMYQMAYPWGDATMFWWTTELAPDGNFYVTRPVLVEAGKGLNRDGQDGQDDD